MTSWRSLQGSVTFLDRTLANEEDVYAFFEENSILGRGGLDPDEPNIFHFEVAIAGRKRRVATLDEAGELFTGHDVAVVAQMLHEQLRKVEVRVPGNVLHGPLDIGAVDVDETDLEVGEALALADSAPDFADASQGSQAQGSESSDHAHEPADKAADSEKDLQDSEQKTQRSALPVPDGPFLLLGDITTAELPLIAAAEDQTIASAKMGALQLAVAAQPFGLTHRPFATPDYSLSLSAGVLSGSEVNPLLLVHRDSRDAVWDWSGELPMLPWITPGTEAHAFVTNELGAAAVARLAVADVVDAPFARVREALLKPREEGARALVLALGLDPVLADVLDGREPISAVPGARLFEPQHSRGSAYEEALAWEVAGEGIVGPEVANVYRAIYLRQPWLVSMVAAGQAAVGGALMAHSFSRRTGKGRSSWGTALGGALVVNALSRIATTKYVESIVNKLHEGENTRMLRS